MKCLLIGGEGNTGKTATIRNIVDWLEYCGFYLNNIVDTSNIEDKLGNKEDKVDFFCTAKKDDFTVIISTASDGPKVINNFKKYYNKYKENSDFIIVIAPIRNVAEQRGELYDCSKEVISDILQIEKDRFEENIFKVDIIKDSNKKFNVNHKNITSNDRVKSIFKIQLTEKFERSKKYKTAFQVYMATRVSIHFLSYWLTSCNLLQEDFLN